MNMGHQQPRPHHAKGDDWPTSCVCGFKLAFGGIVISALIFQDLRGGSNGLMICAVERKVI